MERGLGSVMAGSKKGRRFSGRLAAISSAAILSVYAAGYVVTQGATDFVAASDSDNRNAAPAAPSGGIVAAQPSPSTTTAASSPVLPSVTTTASDAGAYRDGTYVGTGTSRHGSIEATVTVSGGKVTAVQISQCLTRYSCDRISALPSQAVALQSGQVDYVSGATDSSKAFAQAVTNALSYAG